MVRPVFMFSAVELAMGSILDPEMIVRVEGAFCITALSRDNSCMLVCVYVDVCFVVYVVICGLTGIVWYVLQCSSSLGLALSRCYSLSSLCLTPWAVKRYGYQQNIISSTLLT